MSVLALVACERVTAPEALKVADRIEAEVARGRFDNFMRLVLMGSEGTPIPFGQRTRGAPFVPMTTTGSLLLERDGASEQVNGFVIERVYVPFGNVGIPLRRRTLIVWPDSFAYSVVARTENGARPIDRYAWMVAMQDRLHPPSDVRLAYPRDDDAWVGRSGEISIEPAGADSACPPFITTPGTIGGDPSETHVDCHRTTFTVRLDADLDRVGDTTLASLQGIATIHRLHVPEQRLPGMRFTVHCAENIDIHKSDDWTSSCMVHPEAFWRSDTLFAPELGVRIAEFDASHSPFLLRIVEQGASPTPGIARSDYVRWTIATPNGHIIVRDSAPASAPIPGESGALQQISDIRWILNDATMKPGAVRQYIVPAQSFVPGAPRTAMVVIRFERTK